MMTKNIFKEGNTNILKKLEMLAKEFRSAIEKCPNNILPITLQGFPKGACGDASLLLAKYLNENKCGEFEYVQGIKGDRSHAWLKKGNIIIDITADQFEDCDVTVLITEDHSWHDKFISQETTASDINMYDPNTKVVLTSAYESIVKNIAT